MKSCQLHTAGGFILGKTPPAPLDTRVGVPRAALEVAVEGPRICISVAQSLELSAVAISSDIGVLIGVTWLITLGGRGRVRRMRVGMGGIAHAY
jgi:hypothetical protein